MGGEGNTIKNGLQNKLLNVIDFLMVGEIFRASKPVVFILSHSS
jgi:hypothetical protein